MKLLTITTWNNKLYKEYAHRFENTYNLSWPYTVYNEDDGMYEAIPELKAFVERNKHRPTDNFLQDAVRFSYKVYAYCHAIKQYKDEFVPGDKLKVHNERKTMDLIFSFAELGSKVLSVTHSWLMPSMWQLTLTGENTSPGLGRNCAEGALATVLKMPPINLPRIRTAI